MWGHGLLRYENGLKGFIRKSFYKLAHAHLIYSLRSIKIMKKSGFKNTNLYQVNNSLDYDTHVQIRKSLLNSYSPFQNNGSLKIIFIGRLTKQKKLALLLRAQAELIRRGRNINVTFIGDGTEKPKLENLAERLGIAKNVVFIGPCYDERTVGSFLYHADICVSPGEIGLTAIHALTFGTPVITHDDFDLQMPEVESIKDGLTGAFFKKNSAKSLANSIDQFVSTQPKRKRTRGICYNTIENSFTPEYQCGVFKIAVIENCKNA
jgi:glycosyltransferase involved in cell wall biosynthesis